MGEITPLIHNRVMHRYCAFTVFTVELFVYVRNLNETIKPLWDRPVYVKTRCGVFMDKIFICSAMFAAESRLVDRRRWKSVG